MTFVFIPLLFLLLASCGYRLGYPGGGAAADGSGRRIAIPVFENLTFEPLLEQRTVGAIKEELNARGWKVVNAPEEADAVLKGKVTGFDLTSVSLDSSGQVLEYRVRLVAMLTLEAAPAKRVIWKESPLEATAEFFAAGDAALQRTNEDRAIREASRRLAVGLSRRLSLVSFLPPAGSP